jgi:enoyl-CoA hydratase/carnithine racemase
MSDKPEGLGREVLYEVIDEHIAVVTLNRPEARNAVNVPLAQAVDYLVKQIERDPSIRVAILTSSNDRVFCAGADLGEISRGRAHMLEIGDGGLAGFSHSPRSKPWIAAVKGHVLAGGCELALACDMIVASENAQFGLPEVKRGLLAAGGGAYRLPRRLPRNIALELIATGDSLDAQRAAALGLVNRLVAPDKVLDAALELGRRIAANAPLAVRQSMLIARQYADHSEAELRAISDRESASVFASEDAKEGPRAFFEKRKPNWTGR